jgi:hypothetical protein
MPNLKRKRRKLLRRMTLWANSETSLRVFSLAKGGKPEGRCSCGKTCRLV